MKGSVLITGTSSKREHISLQSKAAQWEEVPEASDEAMPFSSPSVNEP
jgi:hypothetical protein